MAPAEQLPHPLRIHLVGHFVEEQGDGAPVHAVDRGPDGDGQGAGFAGVGAGSVARGMDHAGGDAEEGRGERGRHAGAEVEGEVQEDGVGGGEVADADDGGPEVGE